MITIRDAKAEDSDEIFDWRNDPTSRLMFLNTDVVARNDHDQWYAQSLHNPNRKMFIGIYEQSKIGIVRFDLSSRMDEAEVSINLSPEMREKGLSFPLLRGAIDRFIERYPSASLTATIKTTNTASARIFERNGFQFNSRHGDYNHYTRYRIR